MPGSFFFLHLSSLYSFIAFRVFIYLFDVLVPGNWLYLLFQFSSVDEAAKEKLGPFSTLSSDDSYQSRDLEKVCFEPWLLLYHGILFFFVCVYVFLGSLRLVILNSANLTAKWLLIEYLQVLKDVHFFHPPYFIYANSSANSFACLPINCPIINFIQWSKFHHYGSQIFRCQIWSSCWYHGSTGIPASCKAPLWCKGSANHLNTKANW